MSTKRVDELQVGDKVVGIDGRTFTEVAVVSEVRKIAGKTFSVRAEGGPAGFYFWPAPIVGHCTAAVVDCDHPPMRVADSGECADCGLFVD